MPEGEGPSGFWSYAHKDDEQVNGRITRLSKRVRDEFSLITGNDLEIFLDRESIAWGAGWRLRINTAIQETTFFVPVITPRYFTSTECRRELLQFATHARSLGADELLLPILYVRVADLKDTSPDEAKTLIAGTQYVDWTDLRLTEEHSEQYSRAVNSLASRLADIAENYATKPTVVPAATGGPSVTTVGETEDAPGLMDLIAVSERDMPIWTEVIEGFLPILGEINDVVNEAAEKLQDPGVDSFVKRVLLARSLATTLDGPASALLKQGEDYSSLLISMDPGIRAIISIAEEQHDGADIRSACAMFESLRELIDASQENEVILREFISSLRGPARQYRDLRPALTKMEGGMRSVLDAQTVMEEWRRLIDESRLACPE